MIEFHYNQIHNSIQISITDHVEHWPLVSRVFEETAQDVTVISSKSIRVPVWEFLSCRKSLIYVLQKLQLKYSVDEKVRNILIEAANKEAEYQSAKSQEPVSEECLVKVLKERGFIRQLTSHQIRNVSKLVGLSSGATFSVPGAGKTTEALAFYYYNKKENSKLIVVCPKNAFAAWEEQLQLCVKNPPLIKRLIGGEKLIKKTLKTDPEIVLITYQQLPNVVNLLAEYMLNNNVFMFLDESHRIKRGTGGLWASTILNLSHLPVAKLIMSGTPLPNSISDLIPQVNFIYPELYFEPAQVKEIINPIFVRTTKQELGLPRVNRIFTPILLHEQQRNLYELLRSEEYRQLSKLSARERNEFRTIGRSVVKLLQIVSNPSLIIKDDIPFPVEVYATLAEGDSPKIEYACQKARELANHGRKVIIWSTFVDNVETISQRLFDLGADYIHGGVDAGSEQEEDTREWKIKKFHEDKNAFVLVANPAACAEGISLHTVCHHAIYVDRNYNAAQYLQSEDRIHRLGLSPDVTTTVEILYSPDTVDESVKRRLEYKVNQMAKVLNDNSLNIEAFDPDLDIDGINQEDTQDFLAHLKREN